jgi:hypothetical protein
MHLKTRCASKLELLIATLKGHKTATARQRRRNHLQQKVLSKAVLNL